MTKLIVSMDGTVLREVDLDKERITIGRKPHNDIAIDNLAVSGEHARIVTILNDSFLEDLGSTNGTTVNGSLIKKHILQNNDLIEIGKYKLKYVNEAVATAPAGGAADFEKTMIIRSPLLGKTPDAASTQGFRPVEAVPPRQPTVVTAAYVSTDANPRIPDPSPVAKPPTEIKLAAIQVLTGGSAGKEMELTKTLTTLGKPGLQVAVITRRPQGYFITHVEGANFPILNGKTLDAQSHQLNDHDVIELAGVKMEFFLKTH